MEIKIPLWLIIAILPLLMVFLYSFKFSDVSGWGGSERGWYLIFMLPIAVILGLIIIIIRYVGLTHGWWE